MESGLTSLLGDRATDQTNGRTDERSFVPFANSAKPKRTAQNFPSERATNEAPFLSPAAAACSEK